MNLAVSVRSEYSIVKSMVFPVVIYRYELDRKEGWALQNWCFQIVVLEKTLESDLDSKEIKPFNPKGNQPWIFIGRADAEAEVPVLWPTEMKSWLTGKDPDAGKDRRQKEKEPAENEMVGWHHQLDGHEFEQAPAVGDGQGSLACCSPWGCKELDMTEWLNWRLKMNGDGKDGSSQHLNKVQGLRSRMCGC